MELQIWLTIIQYVVSCVLRYLNTLLTTLQWVEQGFEWKQLSNPIVKDKSGWVHSIAYIKHPMALEYDTGSIYYRFSDVCGQSWRLRQWFFSNGVDMSFELCILNLSKTFFRYVSCERPRTHLNRSVWIFTPSIQLASPMPFSMSASPWWQSSSSDY